MALPPLQQETLTENTPLLSSNTEISGTSAWASSQEHENHGKGQIPTKIAHRLYISHFLSTWNSRVFEFGAVLYLGAIFPGTLLPMSVYALSRGLAAIVCAPAVGHYIDVSNRLRAVRLSIVLQRLAVAASCVIFYILATNLPMPAGLDTCLLAFLLLLACVEKLCSILNLVSVERDWVVVVAGHDKDGLKTLNAQMRRIDLVCKLFGPLFIAFLDGWSTKLAILFNLGMNISSIGVEYFTIANVYHADPKLQMGKPTFPIEERLNTHTERQAFTMRVWRTYCSVTRKGLGDFGFYFRHRAFLPSFAGALLYLTVLSFAGQMVTWLLSTGYDSAQIGIARTLSVAFEVLATWVAPWLMGRIGPTRAGLWLASWQIICLTVGMGVFWAFANEPRLSASALVGATILSRLGLRGFDLCAQILVQEGVEADARGTFSSIEAAWQNAFEICSYVSTIVFSRPDQFRWPALLSVLAVGTAGFLYAVFVRTQRGHLLHLPKWLASKGGPRRSREECIERISSASDL